jgi:hypothetical protein
MRNSPKIFSLIAILLLFAGCQEQTSVGSVEIIRGFSSYRPTGSSIIQENDHCFILAVDNHPVERPNEDQGYVSSYTISYRQFEVPPGTHTITVRYYHHVSRNAIETSGVDPDLDVKTTPESGTLLGPAKVPVNITPKHIYVMQSNFNGPPDATHWQPELIDKTTNQPAGQSTLQ